MLINLVMELKKSLEGDNPMDFQIIDDGSEFTKVAPTSSGIIRTHHEGKKGFWKKWVIARQLALGTDHDYFLFIPDDISDLQLDKIKAITQQGWDDHLFALTITNGGSQYRCGKALTGQEPIEISGATFEECCFVDGCFITNRKTLEACDIHEVPASWFDRENKSSGVGYQMTMTMRKLGAVMMRPNKSLAYHGDHESVMNREERINNPLITKQ